MTWLLILTACAVDSESRELPSPYPATQAGDGLFLDTYGLAAVDTSAVEDAHIQLIIDDPCVNPCTLRAEASDEIVAARYEADDRILGTTSADDLSLIYDFQNTGPRELTVYGRDERGIVVAQHTRWITIE